MTHDSRPPGMRASIMVWAGQIVSVIGTVMTGFALTFWTFEVTGRATDLAMMGFFTLGPRILLGPIAGVLVDRWDRKATLIAFDLAAGLSSVAVFALHLTNNLEVWHLYVTSLFAGAFQAFHEPAYLASATMMVSKEQYTRTGGLVSLTGHASSIVAPALAGLLLGLIGVRGVLLFDIATFIVAVTTLLVVDIPQPSAATKNRDRGKANLFREMRYGFRYIAERSSLLNLLLILAGVNLFVNLFGTLYSPMILARTENDELALATVQSAIGIGGVVGGAVIAAWGGPKRKIDVLLIGYGLAAVLRVLTGIERNVVLWALDGFLMSLAMAAALSTSHALWQSKVTPEVQGRALSTRQMIAGMTVLATKLAAGPLADRVLEPAMMPGDKLANTFGRLVGTGSGAGMGLLILAGGTLAALICLSGYLFPAVRDIDMLILDYDAARTPGRVRAPKGEKRAECASAICRSAIPTQSRSSLS
jgi:DHA3 family macrolide efflux protein-like MFS transporter